MGTESKSNVRNRKKSDKSIDNEQEIVKKDAVVNGDEKEAKQKKQ